MMLHPRLVIALLVAVVAQDACTCGTEQPPPGPPAGSAVTVVDASVRSCEALFLVSSGQLPAVTFGSAVVGETIPKAPRFAIAFRAANDESLDGKNIADFGSAAVVERAVCYDAAGAVVAGSPLQVR